MLLAVTAACSSDDADRPQQGAGAASSAPADRESDDVVPGKTTFGPDDDDDVITKAVEDVEKFFAEAFPDLYGQPYEPLGGGLFPYGPDDPPPSCGGVGRSDYREVAGNAFYCPNDDFMAWDTDNLTNDLLDNFGQFTLAIVVAHELGHATQARHEILDGRFITFVTEQQADCFAGAYTKFVQDGGSDAFEVTLADLDNALGGFLLIRDPVGTDTINDPNAHGSAFQRINAFEDGLKSGASRCKEYEDLAINFVPETLDAAGPQQLDLPFNQVEPLVIANLEGFWASAFDVVNGASSTPWTQAEVNPFDPARGVRCGDTTRQGEDAVGLAFYCEPDDTLNWDERRLMPAVYRIGDLAQASIIANLYSTRAQELAGLPRESLEARLQTDCFTGVWVATTKTNEINETLPEEARVELSPGDLDEAVAAFLELGKASASESGASTDGSAFQHLDAFRAGFFEAFNEGFAQGLRTCLAGAA